MRSVNKTLLCTSLALLPVASFAASVFTITPVADTLTVSQGSTATIQYHVKNSSGKTLTISHEFVGKSGSNNTTNTVNTASSTCANAVLAHNESCTLAINVTGNSTGESSVAPGVCAYQGQLCSQAPTALAVTVEASGTEECSSSNTNPECRIFVTENQYHGNLSRVQGDIDVTSCQNDITGAAASVTKANCICEKEAAAAGYGHAGHWRAWLSNSVISASENIHYTSSTERTFVRATEPEVTIVSGAGALLDTATTDLENAIFDDPIYYDTWTGTDASGASTATTCSDWTDETSGVTGTKGLTDYAGTSWTAEPSANNCNSDLHLYCFETPGE